MLTAVQERGAEMLPVMTLFQTPTRFASLKKVAGGLAKGKGDAKSIDLPAGGVEEQA